jgi:hypothetical protein
MLKTTPYAVTNSITWYILGMVELLQDPAIAVMVLTTIAVIFAMFLIYRWGRQFKRVTYEVVFRMELFTVKDRLEDKLAVFYEGKPINSLSILVLKVRNLGATILSTDYERPISFDMGQSSQVLYVEITEVAHAEITPRVEVQGAGFVIDRMLLNRRDTITFRILVKDATNDIHPDARIAGVKQIDRRMDQEILIVIVAAVLMFWGLVFVALGLYLGLLLNRFSVSTSILSYWRFGCQIAGLIFMISAYIWFTLGIFRRRRYSKKFLRSKI